MPCCCVDKHFRSLTPDLFSHLIVDSFKTWRVALTTFRVDFAATQRGAETPNCCTVDAAFVSPLLDFPNEARRDAPSVDAARNRKHVSLTHVTAQSVSLESARPPAPRPPSASPFVSLICRQPALRVMGVFPTGGVTRCVSVASTSIVASCLVSTSCVVSASRLASTSCVTSASRAASA